jgi:hypothetical protein
MNENVPLILIAFTIIEGLFETTGYLDLATSKLNS